MSFFNHRISYKRVIDEMVAEAFNTNLIDSPGLNSPPSNLGGYMFNTLEGVAATYFLIDRSLFCIRNSANRHKAKEHLAKTVLAGMANEYSPGEIKSFVIPVLEKRMNEYYRLMNAEGSPGDRVLQTGFKMIDNFIEDEVDAESKTLAIKHIFEKLSLEPARKLIQLDQTRSIKW